ncbi:MAG: ABC transporter permease [Thermoanaerobaculia bacterium]|nr:MAG: ABC transporter permease [Thermoanaerobaculia bacterium]MBZ0101461.1 ABC transporter permease [Thermoanaerobaculia bacterium]
MDLVRLGAMARKEALQLRRDPRSLLLAFALPVLLLVLFGYAISWDVREISLAVVDQDRTARSRSLVESFEASGYFRVVERPASPGEIADLFARRRAMLALVIPPGFSAAIGSGEAAPVQAILDGSDANTATIAGGYAEAVVRDFGARMLLGGRSLELPLVAESRVWFNEELSSRNMIVPGLIAVIMMVIGALLTSLTVAREWERGTMEQLAATPVGRLEVVFGKLLPYLVIGLADVALSALLGVYLFGVPFQGSVWLLAGLSFQFLAGSLGLGLFISAATRSQVVATQVSMLVTFLPSFLLSGFMFAISVMPKPLQLITLLVPARYFLVVTRGIFLKGVGPDVLAVQAAMMILFATLGLALAVRSFRKELD